MSNMSYCRFENTFNDLLDCQEGLADMGELSDSEKRYKNKLLELCKDIVEEFTPDDDED